jgi:hypothetical protein
MTAAIDILSAMFESKTRPRGRDSLLSNLALAPNKTLPSFLGCRSTAVGNHVARRGGGLPLRGMGRRCHCRCRLSQCRDIRRPGRAAAEIELRDQLASGASVEPAASVCSTMAAFCWVTWSIWLTAVLTSPTRLFAGRSGDRMHVLVDGNDILFNRLQCIAGCPHQLDAAFDFGGRGADQSLDLLGRLGGALCQFAHFLATMAKPRPPSPARAASADFARTAVNRVWRLGGRAERLTQLGRRRRSDLGDGLQNRGREPHLKAILGKTSRLPKAVGAAGLSFSSRFMVDGRTLEEIRTADPARNSS